MAQVRFYPMLISIEKLRALLAEFDEDHFKYLIFQQVNLDSPSRRDEYDLVAFAVGSDGKANDEVKFRDLFRDLNHSHHPIKDKKVAFGNYFLHRNTIVNYTGGGLAEFLLLMPKEYISDPRYVCYDIYIINRRPFNTQDNNPKIVLIDDAELNPCPPNQPGQG